MAQRMNSADEVYRALGSRLGGRPDAIVWELLAGERWPEDVLSGDATLDELLHKYRQWLATIREGGAKVSPTPTSRPPQGETGAWSEALSEIMALHAAQEPYVRAFRKLVLGDKLVPAGKASEWILGRTQAAQEFAVVSRNDMPASPVGPRVNTWESELAVEDYVSGRAPKQATRADFEIDFLYCLADVLESWYGWGAGTSVHEFILTGEVPWLFAAQVSLIPRQHFYPGSSTIVMLVSPRCTPRRVMELYSSQRKAHFLYGQRVRHPTAQDLALAVFVARENDGRPWIAALRVWNEKLPDQAYGDVRSFARDARQAYRRVVGSDLEWKGGRQVVKRPT